MVNEIALAEAIVDLKNQFNKNFKKIVKKYHVDCKILQKYFESMIALNKIAYFKAQNYFIFVQKKSS